VRGGLVGWSGRGDGFGHGVTAGDDVARAGIWSWVRGGGRAARRLDDAVCQPPVRLCVFRQTSKP